MANGFKTGGRKKGTENKITSDIRDKFNQLLNDNLDTLDNDLKALEPKDRINAILQLSKFVIPQLKATEITSTTETESPKINIIYMGEGKEPHLNNDDVNICFTSGSKTQMQYK